MKTAKYSLGRTALVAAGLMWATSVGLAADAAENWNKQCASCHAKDGSGNTKMGKKLKVKDYRDAKVQAEFTDDAAMKAIKRARRFSMPPSWARSVSFLRQDRFPFGFLEPHQQSRAAFDDGPFDHRRVGDHQGNGFGLINVGLVGIGQFLECGACLVQQLFPANLPHPARQMRFGHPCFFIIMKGINENKI